MVEVLPFHQYKVCTDGSRRITLRNRKFLKLFIPLHQEKIVIPEYVKPPTMLQTPAHSTANRDTMDPPRDTNLWPSTNSSQWAAHHTDPLQPAQWVAPHMEPLQQSPSSSDHQQPDSEKGQDTQETGNNEHKDINIPEQSRSPNITRPSGILKKLKDHNRTGGSNVPNKIIGGRLRSSVTFN